LTTCLLVEIRSDNVRLDLPDMANLVIVTKGAKVPEIAAVRQNGVLRQPGLNHQVVEKIDDRPTQRQGPERSGD
jgi:hypothetical protein